MIFEQYKTIFFHVPKTAGYSIEQFFIPVAFDWRIFKEDIMFGLDRNVMTQHLTYRDMLQYKSTEFLDAHFKFAFFRNTWERFCSAFFYQEKVHLDQYQTFDNFVTKTCEFVNLNKYSSGWHFAKQTDWIYDKDGRQILDFVGRYENLDSDFKFLCNKIGVEYQPLKRLNKSKNSEINYRDLFNDTTKQLVAEAYRSEIELFEYKF